MYTEGELHLVVLAIQKFHNPRVGCCGAVRHDSIYPASESIGEFIRVGTMGTLSLSTTPIAYMENGSSHPNVPELKEKKK